MARKDQIQPEPATPSTFTVSAAPAVVEPPRQFSVTPRPEAYAKPERKRYWCGVLRECPVDEIGAAGITLRKISVASYPNNSGEFDEIQQPGTIEMLTTDALEKVLKALETIGIDTVRGDGGLVERAEVCQLGPGNEPAAAYCWIAELGPNDKIGHGRPIPAPLFVAEHVS